MFPKEIYPFLGRYICSAFAPHLLSHHTFAFYKAAATARAAPMAPKKDPVLATAAPDGTVLMLFVAVGATGVPTVGAEVPFESAMEVAMVTPAELV